MKTQPGCLVTCTEDSVKQLILALDEVHHFVIADLDRYHVFIDASRADLVRSEVDRILGANINNPSAGDSMP